MRRAAIASFLLSCSSAPAPAARAPETATATATASAPPPSPAPHPPPTAARPRGPCIVVGEDAPETSVEGTVRASGGALALRLVEPRCVAGIEGASVVTEVGLASEGFDLRPLRDARVRVVGHAIGEATPEGPMIVVIAASAERLAPSAVP